MKPGLNPVTVTVLVVMALALIIFDIVIAVTKGGEATISTTIYRSCQKYPIIAAALGALLYHLVSGAV